MTDDRLSELLQPFLPSPSVLPASLLPQLRIYLELLMRWSARMNLTSVRDPETIVTRHFGESLFAASRLPSSGSLLDFGSGAGFPGIPIQLLRPGLVVTLAESQGKKASFLREAVRLLGVKAEVWGRRAEDLPSGTTFDVVALRAVDAMPTALRQAASHARHTLCILAGEQFTAHAPKLGFTFVVEPLPLSARRFLVLGTRTTEVPGQDRSTI